MKCPRCNEKMESTNSGGINTATCLYCNGTWVNAESLGKLLTKETNAPSLDEIQKLSKYDARLSKNRICPECTKQELNVVYSRGAEIDLCPKYSGVFFDEGELKEVLPTVYKPIDQVGVGEYVAGQSLYWLLLFLLSGGK